MPQTMRQAVIVSPERFEVRAPDKSRSHYRRIQFHEHLPLHIHFLPVSLLLKLNPATKCHFAIG